LAHQYKILIIGKQSV